MAFRISSTLPQLLAILLIAQQTLPLFAYTEDKIHQEDRSAPKASGLEAYNYEIPYLRHILNFIGITDVTFVQPGGTMRVAQGQVSSEEFLAPLLKQIKAAV